MAERMREVVGKHSTWYVCDEHGWDFTNVDEDVCPVCYGESLAEQRIIKLLEEFIENSDLPEVVDRLEWLKDSIEGENK